MKKKVLLMVVMIVLIALMGSICLTGCTLFKLNEERQANDVLATVSVKTDGGQTISLDVTRNELLSYVNYIIYLYTSNNMSYNAEELMSESLDNLINQKYLVIQGMIYLMSLDYRTDVAYMNANSTAYKAVYGDAWTPEGVLTLAERYTAIASTNENFTKSINEYVEDYETEQRNLLTSTAREKLASYYADGYKVADDGVAIYHLDGSDYKAGLYKTSILKSSSSDSEVDYTQIYLQIKLSKKDADGKVVYLPISSTSLTTEEDEDVTYQSNYMTAKVCKVTYDEPVTSKDEETTYTTHTAEAKYTLVTPRTTYKGAEEEDARSDAAIAKEGSVKYRYEAFTSEQLTADAAMQEMVNNGQFFKHTLNTYASDAEKDAYRQFREAKKSLLVGFDPDDTDDYFNGLGYYYRNSFESAVLTAVQHEKKRAALDASLGGTPITDVQIAAQYDVLVNKQAEEYSVLDNKAQIDKFAAAIGTDLTSAYYVPIDALISESFEIDPEADTYKALFTYDNSGNVTDYDHDLVTFENNKYTMKYAYQNNDGTYTINMFYIAHILFKWTSDLSDEMARYISDRDDDEVKEIKTVFAQYLKTNKSKLTFATAEEEGTDVADAFFLNEDGSIAEFSVVDVLTELHNNMVADPDNALDIFKKYMTYFNDDSGTMTSALGYFIATGDISNSYDGSDFPNMAIKLYFDMLAANTVPGTAYALSDPAFTSYGLHMETISFAPFYHIALTESKALGVNFVIDLDGTKFADSIKSSLESDVESKAYSEWTKANGSDAAAEHTVKYDKKYKKMIKDLGL